MRTALKFAILVTVPAVLFCQAALAAELAVPANRQSILGHLGGVTQNCRSAEKPKMKVVKAPAHGTVRFQWSKYKIQNISRLCNGKSAWGMAVVFTPAAGYRGKDSFTYGMSMPQYEGRSISQYHQDTVDIIVK